MQINLSGHHVEITDGIRTAVESKFSKVQSHYPSMGALSVVLTVERNEQSVEARTQFMGASVAVEATDNDLYVAIADAAKKLEAALAHRKGANASHRHERPAG
ncbi:ribosome-associated translation inhibitor RaiA [Saccharophagus sp. K07]|jgi:putative sigma-54 modulation protein|uniref:ribosome hibernation-promoting factor, HPF/YfiA family n=1 Tax=Saccharophagus sp. K07 TaxID=2283636 RepID=UPI001651F4EB|nr:ribosome-associated translation inhibitor RaiA [Saccharophagus sp. K07]MBC6907390.1 ribosome-associated translation inhibitor RaiA [Saccharophagus sp. K07]